MGCPRRHRARQRGGRHTQAVHSGVRDCPNQPLKLTLPVYKQHAQPPRAVQLNKVYQPQGRPMINSFVISPLINDGMDSPVCLREKRALVFIGVGIRSSSQTKGVRDACYYRGR